MEKKESLVDHVSIQGFREWSDGYTDGEVDKKNYAFLSSYLNSFKFSSQEKIHFLEEYSKEIQIELVFLEDQQIFPYQDHSFGISSQQQ